MRMIALLLITSFITAQSLHVTGADALTDRTLLTLPAMTDSAQAWSCGDAPPWAAQLLPGGAPGESAAQLALLAQPGLPRECALVPCDAARLQRPCSACAQRGVPAACTHGAASPWRIDPAGRERELRIGDRLFLRTATHFDAAQHEQTFKSFQHLFAADGTTQITKGAGGKYSHHRGLFLGWNRVQTGRGTADFWHGKDGVSIRHRRFRDDLASVGPACGRLALENDWCLADGTVVLREVRVLTAFQAAGFTGLDIAVALTALAPQVKLGGDAHHAGLHVRAADAVAGREKETRLLLDPQAVAQGNDLHKGAHWCSAAFTVESRPVTLLLVDHPENHSEVMSVRAYGRIGFMPLFELKRGESRVLRWRLVVFDGAAPDAARCAQLAAEYCDPPLLRRS